MNRKAVTITKDGTEATCMPSALPTWERNGWTLVEDRSSDESAGEPKLTYTEWSEVADPTDIKE